MSLRFKRRKTVLTLIFSAGCFLVCIGHLLLQLHPEFVLQRFAVQKKQDTNDPEVVQKKQETSDLEVVQKKQEISDPEVLQKKQEISDPEVLQKKQEISDPEVNVVEFRNKCVGRNARYREAEDLFCLPRPVYEPGLKNPCWWDNSTSTTFAKKYGHFRAKPTVRKLRCLPYFHILCCSKSGTTDLYNRLAIHPDIIPNQGTFGKEQLYWSWARYNIDYQGPKKRGVAWTFEQYISGFDLLSRNLQKSLLKGDNKTARLITLDGSPPDLWDFRGWTMLPQNRDKREPAVLTPHLMRHVYRDPKFIVLMRDPVERVYTAYLFHEMGKSADAFHRDVINSLKIMRNCLQIAQSYRECYFNYSVTKQLKVEVHLMCPVIYLKEWFHVFSKKHFLFMRTESYSKDIKSHLLKVFEFLEISSPSSKELQEMVTSKVRYHTKVKDKVGKMWPETWKLLRDFVQACNTELAKMLEDDIYLWRDSVPPPSPSLARYRSKRIFPRRQS